MWRRCTTTSPKVEAQIIPSSAPRTCAASAAPTDFPPRTWISSPSWSSTTSRCRAWRRSRTCTIPRWRVRLPSGVGSRRLWGSLYILTVADIRGTSPKVWNAWKAKLLEDLFRATRRVLTGEPLARDAALAEKQAEAGRLLRLYALSDNVKVRLWAPLDITYFLRHDAQEIAWHTRNLYYRVETERPVVKARLAPFGEGLQVMIYTRDREALFARISGYFERAGFDIAEAKVHTTRHGYALDTFAVRGQGRGSHYRDLISMLEAELAEEVQSQAPLPPPRGGRVSRRVRHFPISPVVDLRPHARGAYHVLSIVASDRPGLLYAIARTLAGYHVNLQTARINTLGDRAEDVFLVSGEALAHPKTVLQLEQDLLKGLTLQQAAPVPETALR